jgi:hypothetical protein
MPASLFLLGLFEYAVFYNPLPVVLYAPHHENTPVIVLPDAPGGTLACPEIEFRIPYGKRGASPEYDKKYY